LRLRTVYRRTFDIRQLANPISFAAWKQARLANGQRTGDRMRLRQIGSIDLSEPAQRACVGSWVKSIKAVLLAIVLDAGRTQPGKPMPVD
jgi:hypothetical protein